MSASQKPEPGGQIEDNVVFHGSLSELYVQVNQGKIPSKLQGSHTRPCKFWTAAKVLSGIRSSVIITHGPSGCAYGVKQAYKLTNSRNSGAPYEPVLSTNIDKSRIIFGAEKELKAAILEIEAKYAPEIIFVATSCASGIIGDNVEGVLKKLSGKVKALLRPIHCEGFAGEYRSGFDLVFKELVKLMDPPAPELKREMARSVNIVGAKLGPERTEVDTDLKELLRLLELLGAKVNAVIAGNCTLAELRRAPCAAVNCSLCQDIGYAIGTAMFKAFGTPLNSTILPYGIAATEKWLLGAAEPLGLMDAAQALMEREYAAIREPFMRAKEHLAGKTAIIEGRDAVKSLSIAHMLDKDFGMRPVIYNFHPWSAEARESSIDYMLGAGLDPEILITKGTLAFGRYEAMRETERELLEFLGGLDPAKTVYFGSSLSFPLTALVDLNAIMNRPRFGYRGALKVAQAVKISLDYAQRPRSALTKRMVFPEKSGLTSAGALSHKLAQELPDCTLYAAARRRGECPMS